MTAETARPNFLWVTLEDCSPRLGCYGDPLARTPNLDQLAAQGRTYTHAFSTAPVCAPARSAVITGMYASSIGAHHMRVLSEPGAEMRPVPPYECVPPVFVKCVPEYLRAAGYYCTNNWKTDYQFQPPFTAWDENGENAHWRNRPRSNQPFFAVWNFIGTHESGMWAREAPLETDPDAVVVPPYLVDASETRRSIARQYDNEARVDAQVGEIVRQLEEDGLADNTVVVIWSDHGEGLPRAKRHLYDSGLHVPLIVRWPGKLAAGERCHHLVSTIDLGPTLLDLAGLEIPAQMQGRPLFGERASPRLAVFASRDRMGGYYDCVRSVCDAHWHYSRNYQPESPSLPWNPYANNHPAMQDLWNARRGGKLTAEQAALFRLPRLAEELYDVESDPFQINNLAGKPEHRETLERLRRELDDWQREIGDLYAEPEIEMARRFWPDFKQPETQSPWWIAYDPQHDGTKHCAAESITLKAPAMLQLHSLTQGASLGYRFASDPASTWRLYTGPFDLLPGEHQLEAKAIRIGYAESAIRPLQVTVLPG